jgi:hypothetical protein
VTPAGQPDRAIALGRVRVVADRLLRDGTAQARSDGTVHRLFPVAVGQRLDDTIHEIRDLMFSTFGHRAPPARRVAPGTARYP